VIDFEYLFAEFKYLFDFSVRHLKALVDFFVAQASYAVVGGTFLNVLHFEMLLVTQTGFKMITARVIIAARGPFEWQRELTSDRL
jgi:hypothetical protein